MPDITLVNLNMLFMRYGEEIERELHVPLGPLYLARALEDAGFEVDFRDYQAVDSDEPFDMEVFLRFVGEPEPAAVIGLSCMANLLPFTLTALDALRKRYPDRVLLLGGVGSKSVEDKLLRRFPQIDVICRGEGERTAPELLRTLQTRGRAGLDQVAGISFRDASDRIVHVPDLLPEFVFTGHEICHGGRIELPEKHRDYFTLILDNPDLFPGFYTVNGVKMFLRPIA